MVRGRDCVTASSKCSWDKVWIVAGGRSALSFDLELLRGKRVLAVNDAIFLLCALPPLAVAVFSADHRWVDRHRLFLEGYTGECFAAFPPNTYPECRGIKGVTYLDLSFEMGLSKDQGVVCSGGNSGYSAINLAVLRGARCINLIGYDMDPREDDKYRQWAPRFRTMLPQLERLGVQVINHNRESGIDAFPFA
jgi:hypothetical protein